MSKSIVVIGGGIIGTCTAYYLSKHPSIGNSTIRIFEGSYIAAGASGKAGGFLASDWHETRTASLGAVSFKLHQDLSDEYGGSQLWSYRRMTTLEVAVHASGRENKVPGAEWLSSITRCSKIGDVKSTAQVTPGDFTRAMAKLAQDRGVDITIATVTELHELDNGTKEVVAITSDGQRISHIATDVVFAAGPWTGRLTRQLLGPRAGAVGEIVESRCSSSIILRPNPANGLISPHALFTSVKLPDGLEGAPEVYPRADGTVYMCGGASVPDPLPEKASDVHHSPPLVEKLRKLAAFISPSHLGEDRAAVEVAQACYRPDSSRTGAPLIGRMGDGLWVASGHQVWGINNGPGTGKVMAEMILEGQARSADVSALAP